MQRGDHALRAKTKRGLVWQPICTAIESVVRRARVVSWDIVPYYPLTCRPMHPTKEKGGSGDVSTPSSNSWT